MFGKITINFEKISKYGLESKTNANDWIIAGFIDWASNHHWEYKLMVEDGIKWVSLSYRDMAKVVPFVKNRSYESLRVKTNQMEDAGIIEKRQCNGYNNFYRLTEIALDVLMEE